MKSVVLILAILVLVHIATAEEYNDLTGLGSDSKAIEKGAAIQIEKYLISIDDAIAKRNRSMTYLIEVINTGETLLKNVTIIDFLPAKMVFRNARCERGFPMHPKGEPDFKRDLSACNENVINITKNATNEVIFQVGRMDLGEVMRIKLTAEVREGAADPLSNRATARGYFMNKAYSDNSKKVIDLRMKK
jgi:uncharacterized repeat protein (TIGR01451 family)